MTDDEDQQPNQMKPKKLKIVKTAPSQYAGIVIINKEPDEPSAIEGKVEVLREKFNTPIKEIAELLGCTPEEVRKEIARYKTQ